MSEQLFDILKREHLDTPGRIERAIMHERTVAQIHNLYLQLSEAASDMGGPVEATGGGFDFFPNSDIAAHWFGGSCGEWDCRLARIDRLLRFAALWADCVVLPSYFAHCPERVDPIDEAVFRYAAAGDLKVILALKPLMDGGILRLVKKEYHICPRCGGQRPDGLTSTPRVATALHEVYSTALKRADVRIEYWPTNPPDERFCVGIAGPEDVIPGGSIYYTSGHVPSCLPKSMLSRPVQEVPVEYDVPRSKLGQVPEILSTLSEVGNDVVTQHLASRALGTRYLTNRPVDAVFLQALGTSPGLDRLNRVLSQYLSYDMPIIESVPVVDLLRVRRNDRQAFLVYRDSVKRIIDERVASGQPLSGVEARQLFEDVIRPNLNRLDAKVASIQKTAARRLARDVLVTGTVLSAGLFSGLVPAEMVGLVSALGGLPVAKELMNSLSSALGTPDEVRGQDLYFLWQVRRRAKRRE